MNICINSNALITQNALKNRGLSNPHKKVEMNLVLEPIIYQLNHVFKESVVLFLCPVFFSVCSQPKSQHGPKSAILHICNMEAQHTGRVLSFCGFLSTETIPQSFSTGPSHLSQNQTVVNSLQVTET